MNTNKDKDLNELLAKLYGSDEAARAADDIRRGDELLARYPVAKPRPELLADIRTQMLLAHHRRRRAHRLHYVYTSLALAASLAVVCGLAWFYMAGSASGPTNHVTMGNPAFYSSTTEEIATITSQLDQIESSVTAVKTLDADLSLPADLQADVSALEASIWKG
jgi:hypothetical protein